MNRRTLMRLMPAAAILAGALSLGSADAAEVKSLMGVDVAPLNTQFAKTLASVDVQAFIDRASVQGLEASCAANVYAPVSFMKPSAPADQK